MQAFWKKAGIEPASTKAWKPKAHYSPSSSPFDNGNLMWSSTALSTSVWPLESDQAQDKAVLGIMRHKTDGYDATGVEQGVLARIGVNLQVTAVVLSPRFMKVSPARWGFPASYHNPGARSPRLRSSAELPQVQIHSKF